MPYGDPNDPLANTNPPGYIPPDLESTLAGLQGLLGQTYDFMPPNVAGYIPWGEGQMQDWFTKMFTGQRGKRIGGEYETAATSKWNRATKRAATGAKERVYGGGGRGSSEEARTRAEMTGQYASGLDEIALNRLNLEEGIRGEDFGRGMAGVGALENILRGDYQNALQQAMFGMQQTGQEADILGQIGQFEMMGPAGENAFNQWLYTMLQQGGVGSDRASNYIDEILNYLGMGMGGGGFSGGGGGGDSGGGGGGGGFGFEWPH